MVAGWQPFAPLFVSDASFTSLEEEIVYFPIPMPTWYSIVATVRAHLFYRMVVAVGLAKTCCVVDSGPIPCRGWNGVFWRAERSSWLDAVCGVWKGLCAERFLYLCQKSYGKCKIIETLCFLTTKWKDGTRRGWDRTLTTEVGFDSTERGNPGA